MALNQAGPRSNKQGIWGWLSGGRYGLERKLYIIHRLTGLGLIFYLPLHIYITHARVLGEARWESTMEAVHNPFFVFGEYLLFVAFAFHALNGLRLVLTELGYFIGEPHRPIYPHVTSVDRQRPLALFVLIVFAVVILVAGYDFLM